MVAYVIAERVREWDGAVFKKYGPLAAASIERFGGRYLARSDKTVALEGGEAPPLAMAVIEFPSLEQAQAWFASDEYQQAASIRRQGAQNRFLLVQGRTE
jgi:uncharacterized protein (DUF1330 family)